MFTTNRTVVATERRLLIPQRLDSTRYTKILAQAFAGAPVEDLTLTQTRKLR
jgi:hypothetical protein